MRGLHSLTPNNRAKHVTPAGFRWFNFGGQKGEAPPGDVVRGERYVSPSPASRPSANPPAKSMQPRLCTASNANKLRRSHRRSALARATLRYRARAHRATVQGRLRGLSTNRELAD